MNCEQSRQYYRELQIEAADVNHQKSFDEHTSTCAKCQTFISSEEVFIAALRKCPTEAAPERLLNNVMRQIAHKQKIKLYKVTNIGFGFALAASLVVALMMPGYFNNIDTGGSDPLSTITMSVNSERTINIVFDSPESVADAVITLSLPDNIRIAGYESRQQLQWNAKLDAGKNTLKLPLIASSAGSGIIKSTLNINGKSKNITLLVDVSSDKISTNIINTTTT